MIHFNSAGYPIDALSKDSMDSCVRDGVIGMCGYDNAHRMASYESNGYGVRCPKPQEGKPSDNPNNFTKDQLMLLLAGLKASNNVAAIRRLFWAHAKRLFFCQNIDRDVKGSTKSIIPHKFYKDSNPVPTTYTKFSDEDIDPSLGVVESKAFDYRDPLGPNHIWAFIVATKYYWLIAPLAVLGIPIFILGLLLHSKVKGREENQSIAEAYLNGKWALRLFKKIRTNWKQNSYGYWNVRQEIEYHEMLVDLIDKA